MTRWLAVGAATVLVLASCQVEAPDPDDPMGRTPSQLEIEKQACEGEGGTWARGGLYGLTCFKKTPDGGKSCSAEDDCTGYCLADLDGPGGHCAEISPTFGCFEVFMARGERVTLCAD